MDQTSDRKNALQAGAASANLTPQGSVFLFGYPHVPRYSTGVNDQLETAALYLRGGDGQVLFIANDLIFVGKQLAADVRRRICIKTGVPISAITITATHTHSGPVMRDYAVDNTDPVVPKVDPDYLTFVADQMVEVGCAAVRSAVPAEAALAVARAEGVGTNRHDPAGPADPEVPVLVVRPVGQSAPLACMVTYAMHPTVLHEDSTLISADFPGYTRTYLRAQKILPPSCPILYHNGASGNQSPRYVTRANTLAEARRLGETLGLCIARVFPGLAFSAQFPVTSRNVSVELELRDIPPLVVARENVVRAAAHLAQLRGNQTPKAEVRTAECASFGAEKSVVLARAAAEGRLEKAVKGCSPAELQLITLGPWKFVTWPGEFFVEYALEVKARSPQTFVITFANGELQGYIVTPEAVAAGSYEAGNALFSPANGRRVVEATLALLGGSQ
jgi:neutral ceramidase